MGSIVRLTSDHDVFSRVSHVFDVFYLCIRSRKAAKVLWTEDEEVELRNLYDKFKETPEEGLRYTPVFVI